MASKKQYDVQNIFSTGQKIGGVGASISYAAFEKVGHFDVIPKSRSFALNGKSIFERIIPK